MLRSGTLALAFTALSTACWAQTGFEGPSTARAQRPLALSCVRLEVVSESRTLAPLTFRGARWVEGRPGSEYALVVRNDCGRRVLAVLSVDGLNVLDGKIATTGQGGYVVDSGRSVSVAGWRKSQQEVAAFYFSAPSDSYASRTGRPLNVGVIGAAFFAEKPQPVPEPPMMQAPADGKSMNPRQQDAMRSELSPSSPPGLGHSMPDPSSLSAPSLGTGHGRRADSPTRSVEFNREPIPMHIDSLRYESRERLEEMGALPRPQTMRPNPFPGQPSFTPDPPSR